MDPITGLMLANGLLQMYLTIAPLVEQQFKSGQVLTGEQQVLWERYQALKAQLGVGRFVGPEWNQQPVPETPITDPAKLAEYQALKAQPLPPVS